MLNISKLKLNNIDNKLINNKGELNNNIIYHPTFTKEWFNSIYYYYKNNEKNIPVLDIFVFKIIKNYFNMYSSQLERSIFLRKKSDKRRRYSLNKILISKPEFKHTNDKVRITLYIYNTEFIFLNVRMKNLKKRILAQYFYKIFTTKYITLSKLHLVKSLIKRVNLLKSYIGKLKTLKSKYLNRFSVKNNKFLIARKTINNYYQEWFYLKHLTSYMYKRRLLPIGKTLNRFEKKIRNNKFKHLSKSIKILKYLSLLFNRLENNTHIKTICLYNKQVDNMPIFSISKKAFINKIRKMIFRLKLLFRYNKIITFNKLKFSAFLSPLRSFLEIIYKKNVEFDVITVKNYKFNSSLLTQVMAIKLKNRKNKIMGVINAILSKIKLPINKRHDYLKKMPLNRFRQNIIIRKLLSKKYIYNKPIINLNSLNNVLNKSKNVELNKISFNVCKGDKLNLLLNSIYLNENTSSHKDILSILENKYVDNKLLLERNLENTVLDSIKNKSISGIKIEASGRLTKRIVAARSTYKLKQKGTIKNINSSYKKLSSLLLRGNLNSNMQYIKISNKTRIGSFGLKGWISSI